MDEMCTLLYKGLNNEPDLLWERKNWIDPNQHLPSCWCLRATLNVLAVEKVGYSLLLLLDMSSFVLLK